MGTSATAAEFAQKLSDAANFVDRNRERTLGRAAEVFADEMEKSAARHGLRARSSVLAGKPWRGVRANQVRGGSNPVWSVKAANPAHFHNDDTRSHWIAPKAFGRSRRARVKAAASGRLGPVRYPGRPRALSLPAGARASAHHSGTRGKRWWQKTRKAAVAEAADAYHSDTVGGLARIFR